VGTMVEVGETEDPSLRRRSMKKAAQKSAEGTRKAMQTTRDSLRGSATAVAKAIKFKQREEVVDNEPASSLMGTGRNDSEDISLVSPSCDSTASPVDNVVLNFLTADTTIVMSASLSVVLAITLRSWSAILDDQVPLSVAGSWVLLAFAFGRVFSVPKLKTSHRELSPPSRDSSSVSDSSEDSKIISEVISTPSTYCIEEKKEKADTHRFFRRLLGRQQEHIKSKGVPESAPKSRPSKTNLQLNRENPGNLVRMRSLLTSNRDPDVALAKKFGEIRDWE
jgi:hypothetical protein